MAVDLHELNLRHLRAVLAIRDQGGVSAATEQASLSQSALTQGLAKLERQLGQLLFERRSNGMAATEAGVLLAGRVQVGFAHLAAGCGRMARGFAHPERLMTMTQLRGFLALAEAGGYIAAARMAGMSQTAVHRAVGDLEQVVGGALVERRGRGIWLNAAGRRLARGARLALTEIAAAITDLEPAGASPLISVGATPLSRCFLLPGAMARMVAEQNRARFDVLEGSWRELVEPLRDGVLDIVVGALRPALAPDLTQIPLYDDRLVIAAGSQHPLAGSAMPPRAALAAYPWIVARANSALRLQWEQFFAGGPPPATPIECGSVMVVSRLLTEGNFLTLLSPDQVALQIRLGLLAMVGAPLAGSVRTIGAITRRGWHPTTMQHRFLALLGEVAAAHREAVEADPERIAGYAALPNPA